MTGVDIEFKNQPQNDGSVKSFTVKNCLVYPSGDPAASRPRIMIHLPKADMADVIDSWVSYNNYDWHVIGMAAPTMDNNTPTPWNRFAVAERVRYL